jgi:hypothetical protein
MPLMHDCIRLDLDLESIISPLGSCRHLVIRLTISSLDCASSLCLLPSHHRVRLCSASHSQTHLDCISPSSFRLRETIGLAKMRAHPPSGSPKCSRHALPMELILTPSDRLILIAAPPALIPPSLTLSCRLLLHPAFRLIRLI